MRLLVCSVLLLLMVPRVALAKELPDAPSTTAMNDVLFIQPSDPFQAPSLTEKRTVDKTFVGLALISTGATFADSYTTLFARQNWLAGKKGVCNMEVQSAYLYGTHPTVARAYAVASVKSADFRVRCLLPSQAPQAVLERASAGELNHQPARRWTEHGGLQLAPPVLIAQPRSGAESGANHPKSR